MRLQKLPLAALFAACASSCSGGMGSSTAGNGTTLPQTPQFLPITQGASQASQISTQRGSGSASVAMQPYTTSSTFRIQGLVTSVSSGQFTLNLIGSCSGGYYHVNTSSSTSYSGRPAVGYYAVVYGTGSCATSMKASSMAASRVSSMKVSGSVASVFTGGFTLGNTACGSMHVFVAPSTSGSIPSAGHSATVSGKGSCSTYVVASTISSTGGGGGSDTSVMPHVLTSDYLSTPWGSTSVPFSTAAKYLTWAETGGDHASAISAAGMKTMTYVAPFRVYTGNSMYEALSSIYAHTCSGSKIYDRFDGAQEWVTNPASSDMRANFVGAMNHILSQGHFDAFFEDNAGTLTGEAVYAKLIPGYPCDYSDSSWLSAEVAMNQYSPRPVVANALSALNGHLPSTNIAMLNGSNTLGGNMEDCYGITGQPKEASWLWLAIENTELQVAARGKQFTCMNNDENSASASIGPRLYSYASFLLTYKPSTSVYRTLFVTGSGFHVMPETGFVPLNPLISTPSNVAGLQVANNVYARRYASCYLRGSSLGACAVVVNVDRVSSHPFPYSGFHHTLAISGSSVVDGGTVSASGSAPGSMPPLTGVIALP